MVFYFVTKGLVPGSLFQRFVDGDDEFRNSRLKLIPLVPKVYISLLLISLSLFLSFYVSKVLKQIDLHNTQIMQGSWIVRQSVGSTPCLLGKAVDCNYIRGPTYLEVSPHFVRF